jgi:hypothetical protein
MKSWIKSLDRVLRGEATQMDQLREGTVPVPATGLTIIIILLGAFYGACMGLFGALGHHKGHQYQIPAAMAKVPAVFLLTLFVCGPSLYVFSTLMGSKLRFMAMLRLQIAALAVMLAVLASLGPIVAFFSLTTNNYDFMLLLNVTVFGISGVLGLKFLLATLRKLMEILYQPIVQTIPSDDPSEPARVITHYPESNARVRLIFYVWVLLFGVVGCQMGWVLRPFVGSPFKDFEFIRPKSGNFLLAIIEIIKRLSH